MNFDEKVVGYDGPGMEEYFSIQPVSTKSITAREIREIPGVTGVYELLTDSVLECRTMWIQLAWWTLPKRKRELEEFLQARKAADTFINVVRFDWQVPKGAMHAYDY